MHLFENSISILLPSVTILVMDTPSTAHVRVNSTSDLADQPLPPSPTSTDGWGELENGIHEEPENDKDGWDDIEPLEEPKPSPSLANIQAAQKRPVSQPASQQKQGRLSIHLLVADSILPFGKSGYKSQNGLSI